MPRGLTPTGICDFGTLLDVDDVDCLAFLGADEDVTAIRAEDRVLGVLAAHLDDERLVVRSRVDKDDLVVLLDGGGHPAAVNRDADAFGRSADGDRGAGFSRSRSTTTRAPLGWSLM